MPWYLGNSAMMRSWEMGLFGWGLLPLALWSLLWSGLALWHAARREDKGWFVLFLLVHTAGILEIIYLVFVVKAFGNGKKSSRRRRA